MAKTSSAKAQPEQAAEPVDVAALQAKVEDLQKQLADANAAAQRATAALEALKAKQTSATGDTIAIRYIGRRDVYKDGACGSGLTFQKGEVKQVPRAAALKMVKHPDVYERADGRTDDNAPAERAKLTGAEIEEQNTQDVRDSIARMDTEAVLAFVKTNFNQDFDPGVNVEELRARATQLVDQFGVA